MREVGHFIGGKHVAGKSGKTADIFQPMDGTIQGKVALATSAEVREAVENAKAAQPAWGAMNPQRRIRIMRKFLELVEAEYDSLAELLAREHGKTVVDAKGDIQRGLEVIEVCLGAAHMLKGEFTDNAGSGIDTYSMRQPLGVVAGITPFNFPAMIPLWKAGPAIVSGNAFILKPSERDPGVPMRLAELFIEAGLPAGIFNVVNGDKEAVDALLDDKDVQAIGFVGSTPIAQYIYGRATANGKRAHCFGGAKNHLIIMPDADMDQTVDALIGAGYGSAGERCMAISVAVPVGKDTAERLLSKLVPRVESLKVGPSTDASADFGPVVTKQAKGALTVPSTAFRYRPAETRERGFSLLSMFTGRGGRGRWRDQQEAKPAEGTRTLYVLANGRPRRIDVKIGATDGDRTEVLSGLKEGDQVITASRQGS